MRLILRVLGAELLAIEFGDVDGEHEHEAECEAFGFHGGPGGQVEHAGDPGNQELRSP